MAVAECVMLVLSTADYICGRIRLNGNLSVILWFACIVSQNRRQYYDINALAFERRNIIDIWLVQSIICNRFSVWRYIA